MALPDFSIPINDPTRPPTLSERVVSWIEEGGRERLAALVDFVIDEYDLYEIEEAPLTRDHPTALQTLQRWVEGGTGPRDDHQDGPPADLEGGLSDRARAETADRDFNDFDCRR